MQTAYLQQKKKQQGFTLLELLVVVSVLATLAGITAVAMDGYEQESQKQLVHVEMQRIASAIYRFKEDTGYFPKEGVFSPDSLFGASTVSAEKTEYINNRKNLAWLFRSPIQFDTNHDGQVDAGDVSGGTERMPWNINAGRGWHGPYLEEASQERLSNTDCDLASVSSSDTFVGLSDTFERKKTASPAECVVVLDGGSYVPREHAGKPYEYIVNYTNPSVPQCTGAPGCLALLSYGPDSTKGTNDDIVHVFRVNP